MTRSLHSFEEDRLSAARAFAQTMIVVDDEAGEHQSIDGASTDEINIVEPGRHDTKGRGESDQRGFGPRLSHPLNQKALIESALDLGLVCAVVKPDKNQRIANRVANAAERADIVSLDWQMNDDGEKAISIIKEIIRRDAKRGGRLRLIAIYTGINDRGRILNRIFQSISERTRNHHNILVADDRIVSDNGLVESRTGAPALGSGGLSVAFAPGLSPAPVAAFPVPAHRTRRADFRHRALQWDHAPRTRTTGTKVGTGPVNRRTVAAARRPSCLLHRRRCVAEPVHASTTSNRSRSTPSLLHVTRSGLSAIKAGS